MKLPFFGRGKKKQETIKYEDCLTDELPKLRVPPLKNSQAPIHYKTVEEGDRPLTNRPVNAPHGYEENMSYFVKNRPASARSLWFEWRDRERTAKKKRKLNLLEREMWHWVRRYTNKNVWYYQDRMGVPRGPANLPVLKECWVHGIIDMDTMVWGQGLADFLPIRNIRTLMGQIRTPEVRFSAWVKKHIALKPALARIRKERAQYRITQSDQVDAMI